MTVHPHRRITSQFGERAEVDEDIALLIQALWHMGIETSLSCQDNVPKGYVWISFTPEDGLRFLQLISDSGIDEEIRECVRESCKFEDRNDPCSPPDAWYTCASTYSFPEDGDECTVYLDFDVRFPRKHLRQVTLACVQLVLVRSIPSCVAELKAVVRMLPDCTAQTHVMRAIKSLETARRNTRTMAFWKALSNAIPIE